MKVLTPSFEFALKNLFIISILFVTSSAAANQLQFQGGNFNVSWKYLSASQEIEFEVRVKTNGYVALGLTKTKAGMRDLDIFAGGVNASSSWLKDYKASGTEKPPEDPQQDYTLLSASESNGETTVRCKRKLNTGDANDQQIQPGDSLYIAWAYHASSDDLIQHTSANRGYSSQQVVLVQEVTPTSVVQDISSTTTVVATTSQAPPPTTSEKTTTTDKSSATTATYSAMVIFLSLARALIVN